MDEENYDEESDKEDDDTSSESDDEEDEDDSSLMKMKMKRMKPTSVEDAEDVKPTDEETII